MSMITVVTRIFPITSVSEDFSKLLKPSDLGKPIEVHKRSVTDPRSGLKYIVETTFCIGKSNALETPKKCGLVPLTDSMCALNYGAGKRDGKEYAFSVPKSLTKDEASNVYKLPKLKELDKDMPSHPSIKLHLNLKKIREATLQQSLSKKREKLVQPLFKYFVNDECLICGVILDEFTKTKVMTHMFLHLKLGTYACQNCENKCFSTADALFNHTLKHPENKKYVCDMCTKNFSRKHFLSEHYQNDHPEFHKPTSGLTANLIKKKVPMCFVCTACKVKLTSWKMLIGHKKAHPDKEGYLCLFCNKSFATSSLLRYHTHVRIISKRYSCKSCHKAFSSMHKLRKHEKIHSRKVKYKCKTCDKAFNFKNNLVEHMQLHA